MRSAKVKAILRQKNAPSNPVCVFCGGTGFNVHFSIFNPRFEPFGTACVKCEATLPPDTKVPRDPLTI